MGAWAIATDAKLPIGGNVLLSTRCAASRAVFPRVRIDIAARKATAWIPLIPILDPRIIQ